MNKINIFCLSLLMTSPLSIYAQEEEVAQEEQPQVTIIRKAKKQEPTRTVSGKVVAQSGEPLAGVLIQSIAGQGYSTLSDEDGTFTMEVPVYSSAVSVTIPGYNTVRVGLNKSGKLRDIVLQTEAAKSLYSSDDNINNVVSTGSLEFSNARNIKSEIENQLGANVRTIDRSGALSVGSYMNIGGVNSLSSNSQPLVVIDGVIMNQQYDVDMLHSGYYNDILTNYNINDIDKVEVLSNGTALYGSKGANGVILITTKRCKSLATRIEAIANVGLELVPSSFDLMSGAQYKTYASELLQSTGTTANNFRFLKSDPNYYWYNKYNNDTRWADHVYKEALTQSYALNVQGGGDVAKYMLSVGYTYDNNTVKENDLNRLNVRFNTDISVNRNLDIRFDAAFTNQTRNLFDMGAPTEYDAKSITSLTFLSDAKSPMLSPYSFALNQINKNKFDIVDEDYLDEVFNRSGDSNYRLANPSAITEYGKAENKNYFDNSYVNIAITPEYRINRHLKARSLFCFSTVNTNEKYYVPLNGVPSYYVKELQATRENEAGSQFVSQTVMNSDTKLEWNNSYGAHNIDLMGGFRFISEGIATNTQHGYDTGNDKTPYLNNTTDRTSTGISPNWIDLSWYGQAKYNYANRYYVEGSLAMQTNSQFGRDVKSGLKLGGVVWGLFPSLQLGWIASNEKFFDVKGIDYLKFTAGYSMSGNDDMVFDASRSYLTGKNFYMQQIAGITLSNVGNTELQWETTRRLNAGIELNALNNNLGVKFNYFKSWTSNLITLQELGFVSGMDYNYCNGGSLTNEGFDVSVVANVINTKNWNWSIGASMGHYVNKLTEVPEAKGYIDTKVYGATIRSQVGESVNSFYGFRTDGVFATTESTFKHDGAGNIQYDSNGNPIPLLSIVDETGKSTAFQAGDVKFVDLNNDGVIDDNDRTFIGNANPDIYGNIFTNLSYKNLTLNVNFNYSLGGEVFNYNRQQLESGSRFMNQTSAMLNRWVKEGQVTDMPKVAYGDPMGNSRFSDRWMEDASYLRLKSLTLSYKLPIDNTFIQGITVWGQANNLFTLTNYLGKDPEFSCSNSILLQGIDTGLLARGRSFHLGVKINL